MTTLVASLEGLGARERERFMLIAIGRMARGEILASEVHDEQDLRQLAYLASLSRNRVRSGGDRLTAFFKDALSRIRELPVATAERDDPLQQMLGARWFMDPGKVRSEADLHVEGKSSD